jgi:hypothetical protein
LQVALIRRLAAFGQWLNVVNFSGKLYRAKQFATTAQWMFADELLPDFRPTARIKPYPSAVFRCIA